MAKKSGLGKGLDAIFGDGLDETIKNIEDVQKSPASKDQVVSLPLSKIEANPYQPRRHFDEEKLNDLANSIKENGLITPIVVKETKGDKYYIVAGERRYRAHKLAGKRNINAIVIKITDKKMAELAIVENVQREDLNPIEEATAINALMKTHKLTQAGAAKVIGKSRSYVAGLLTLLKLDDKIINGVLEGKITYGHAKPLSALDPKIALEFYDRIVEEEWTVRDVENKTKAYKLREAKANKKTVKPKKDAFMESVEDNIRSKVHAPVKIENKKIIIKFRNNDHLNKILKRLDLLED